jgi:hypothetical protein
VRCPASPARSRDARKRRARATDGGITPASTLEQGVEATLRLIRDPELKGVSGVYFNGTGEARPDAQAYDADARRQLRELSERLTA